VSRPLVLTRTASHDDLVILLALWDELRQVGGRAERAVNPITAVDVCERLTAVLDDPTCRVVIACSDGSPAGMAVLHVVRPDPLSDAQLVHIAHLVVSRSKQHHGVGHALVAAAADFATERHIDHVGASVYQSLRDASRFFARLGFAPLAVRRIAPVTVLRRRLDADATMPLMGDAVRRRTRLLRPVPPQRARRAASDRMESVASESVESVES
jgi:GNAT superfamily N-acetyltransferase